MPSKPPATKSALPELIDTPALLRRLCKRLADEPRLAIDTEFVSERTYYPVLGLVQIAAGDVCSVVDPIEIEDISPLRDLLTSPKSIKVFHAGNQDLALFYEVFGEVPSPVFDTQLAAAFVGYGEQVSYAKLVERISKVSLSKQAGLTDWTRRPLSAKQLSYALDDVRYLLEMHQRLLDRLDSMGRGEWFREELDRLGSPETYQRPEPEAMFQNVKRWSTLDRRKLAILRELAAWRELEARERDRPRGRVVSDDILVEIARLAPDHPSTLKNIRPLHPRERKRSGNAIVEAVQRAVELSESEWPSLPKRRPGRRPEVPGVIELLNAYLRCRAEAEQIAPRFVATRDELEQLVKFHGNADFDSRLLHGWRRKMVGRDLLSIIEGRRAAIVDREKNQIRLVKPATAE